jgi:signal peptidase II
MRSFPLKWNRHEGEKKRLKMNSVGLFRLRRTSSCLWIYLAFLWAACLSPALAQDRILLQQPGGSRIPLSGYIEDYNGRELLLKLKPGDPVRRFPRSEIVEVTTEYTPRHDKGRRLFAAARIDDAKVELAAALNEEDRPWVRREILALLVKCALWTGDYLTAVNRFTPIVTSDPETFHYGLIPLNWTTSEPPARMRFDLRDWVGNASKPLMKLIGASWLLAVPDSTIEAEQILRKLTRESDVRIQRLAQMQLWRVKVQRSDDLNASEIEHWNQFVEDLPVELRGGAYFLIGQAWKQRREYDRAARAYLWLPLVFDADRWLSANACYEAAGSLKMLGDSSQAANLYREVVFRYGDTPSGIKAETDWNALLKETAPSKAE